MRAEFQGAVAQCSETDAGQTVPSLRDAAASHSGFLSAGRHPEARSCLLSPAPCQIDSLGKLFGGQAGPETVHAGLHVVFGDMENTWPIQMIHKYL